jgi:ligand-binding sensor domain-containing protein
LSYLFTDAQTKNFFFKTLTTKDGLSYNLVNCLLEDKEGYIWVGTFNGLNRYDGSDFIIFKYDRNNANTIAHNNVIGICEDKQGDIWAATPNGVSRYSKKKNIFINYSLESKTKNAIASTDAENIICDRHGNIWVTSSRGLYKYIPGSNTFHAFKNNPEDIRTISSNEIERNSLLEDPQQDLLWIATSRGINCLDLQKEIFYNYKNNPEHLPVFDDHDVSPLALDKRNRLVFADYSDKKMIFYSITDRTKTATEAVITHNTKNTYSPLSCIFFDSKNNGWFGSWGNMIYYTDESLKNWSLVQHDAANPSSINSDFFWDAIEAKDGRVFIGGAFGLSIYNPGSIVRNIYNPAMVFPLLKQYNFYTSLAKDNTGKLWFGNATIGLFSYDFINNHYEHYMIGGKDNPGANKVLDILCTKDMLWLGTADGLYTFNHEEKKFKKIYFDKNASGLPVNRCYADSKNNIWIAVARKSLYRYNPSTNFCKHYNPDSEYVDHTFYSDLISAAEDKNGNLWFGGTSGQLYQYDFRHDRFIANAPDANQRPAVLQKSINALYADDNGKVWMATEGGGLVQFDTHTKKFKSWMENDGLVMDICNKLIDDNHGRLWVGSYEGFSIFNMQNEKIEISKVNEGLRENDFFSRGWLRLKNGEIVVPNGGNLVVIDQSQISNKENKPIPVITGITVFTKHVPLYQSIPSITLSYKENFFTFNFSVRSSFNKGEIEYAYKLLAYDKDWNYSSSRNFAAYTGVPGGQYQFEVKARYKRGDWGSAVAFPVYISPPFWETWWFRSLAIAFIIAVVLITIKRREKRLLRDEKLQSEFRERITATEMQALRSQMNPHFLYNSLNAIRLFVLQNDSDNAEKYLVKFARLMRLILDNSREEWITIGSELEQLQLYMELEQLRFDNKFDFGISVDALLQSAKINIPPMILQPHIENAILHGIAHKQTKGSIQLRIATSDHQLECIIEDDGVGRQKASQLKNKMSSHKSVGLKVTEERLQLLSLRTGKKTNVQVVDLYNEENIAAGTKVIIHLPLIMQ